MEVGGGDGRPVYVVAVEPSRLIQIDIQRTKALLDVREANLETKLVAAVPAAAGVPEPYDPWVRETESGVQGANSPVLQGKSKRALTKEFIQGQKLMSEGQPITHAYIIREGDCKIYSERNPIQFSKKEVAARNK